MKFFGNVLALLAISGFSNVLAAPIDTEASINERGYGAIPGLNDKQSEHARNIMKTIKSNGHGIEVCHTLLTCSYTESTLIMWANPQVPESQKYPNEGNGQDKDSVGLYQMRKAWFTNVNCDMDAACSTNLALGLMKSVPNWQNMGSAELCQRIERSEKPDAYQPHVQIAINICASAFYQA